jgi:hypothetical protein
MAVQGRLPLQRMLGSIWKSALHHEDWGYHGFTRTCRHGSTIGGMSFEWGDEALKGMMVRAFWMIRGILWVAVSLYNERCCASSNPFQPPSIPPTRPLSYLYPGITLTLPGQVGLRSNTIQCPLWPYCVCVHTKQRYSSDRIISPCISHCNRFFVRSERNPFVIHTTSLKGVAKLPQHSFTYTYIYHPSTSAPYSSPLYHPTMSAL